MRLNVGSGDNPAPGWVNVDLNFKADVKADIYALPFRSGTFTKVYIGHVLEHLDLPTVPRALAEVRRVCVPGAQVAIVGPCMNRALKTNQPEWLLKQIRYDKTQIGLPGEHHAWTPTETLTLACAISGGLLDARAVPVAKVRLPEWPNAVTDPWQCAILARSM